MNSFILVTGSAGFIGFHLSKRLLDNGNQVVGIDNLNEYYDVSLKEARLNALQEYNRFSFYNISLEDNDDVQDMFSKHAFYTVVNLAAQAGGVRYSLTNPYAYINSNIVGFLNILGSM